MGRVAGHHNPVRLIVRNIDAILPIDLTLLLVYFVIGPPCSLGAVWFLPFAAATLGVAWRQLAGIEATPSA